MTRNFIWMLAAARRKQIWRAERGFPARPLLAGQSTLAGPSLCVR